jgi:hypothetical protein
MKKKIQIAQPEQPLPEVLVGFRLQFREAFRVITERFPNLSRATRRDAAQRASRDAMRTERHLVKVEQPKGKFIIISAPAGTSAQAPQ